MRLFVVACGVVLVAGCYLAAGAGAMVRPAGWSGSVATGTLAATANPQLAIAGSALTPSDSWLALRLRMGFASSGPPSSAPLLQEFRDLPSGARPDAVNLTTREVVELKPNTPAAIRRGNAQLRRYADELNREFPGRPFTTRLVTYSPYRP